MKLLIATAFCGLLGGLSSLLMADPMPTYQPTIRSEDRALQDAMTHLEGTISDWNVSTHRLKLSSDFITKQ